MSRQGKEKSIPKRKRIRKVEDLTEEYWQLIINIERALLRRLALKNQNSNAKLTARATGQSAHFYGEYVGQNGRTHDKPEKLLSTVSHNRITPFRGGFANRHIQQRSSR